jgi:hypothetical protein
VYVQAERLKTVAPCLARLQTPVPPDPFWWFFFRELQMAKHAIESFFKIIGIGLLIFVGFIAFTSAVIEHDFNKADKAKEELRQLTTTPEERQMQDLNTALEEQDKKKREKINELEKKIKNENN